MNPFPGQDVGEGAQNNATSFDRPDFIQVTDGRAQLQLHPFAVWVSGIHYVRPVEATGPKPRIPSGTAGNGVSLRAQQRAGGGYRRCRPNTDATNVNKASRDGLRPGMRGFAQLGISGQG